MKEKLIVAALITLATNAQAFVFTVPMFVGIAVSTSTAMVGGHTAQQRELGTDLMIDLQTGMPVQEALAKACVAGNQAACRKFHKELTSDHGDDEYTKQLMVDVQRTCREWNGHAIWGVTTEQCLELGVPKDEMRDTSRFGGDYDF